LSVDLPIESVVEKVSELTLKDVPAFGLRRKSEADVIFDELIGRPRAWSESTQPRTTSENHRPTGGDRLSPQELDRLFSSMMYLP
jgi:hypothetical protein